VAVSHSCRSQCQTSGRSAHICFTLSTRQAAAVLQKCHTQWQTGSSCVTKVSHSVSDRRQQCHTFVTLSVNQVVAVLRTIHSRPSSNHIVRAMTATATRLAFWNSHFPIFFLGWTESSVVVFPSNPYFN
jgi:hypothetical protein